MNHPAIAHLGNHSKFIACFVRSLGASWPDAHDITQSVMIRALEHIQDFSGTDYEGELKAWLIAIARNAYFDHCRRSRSQLRRISGYAVAVKTKDTALCAGIDACALEDFKRQLMALGAEQRETFCRQALGEEYQEIADRCGVALGTVKSRIARAREALQV